MLFLGEKNSKYQESLSLQEYGFNPFKLTYTSYIHYIRVLKKKFHQIGFQKV